LTFGARKAAKLLVSKKARPRGAAAFTRYALVLASHPEWFAWGGLAAALLCLFQSLGLADSASLDLLISSDSLWPVNLFTDLFHDGYSLSGWHFSIAPCWFPDVAATGLFWAVTRNVILATLLAGFVQIALIISALHMIGRVLGMHRLALQDSLLLSVGVAITLFAARPPWTSNSELLQFFLPQSHVGNLISVLWGWALALLWVCRQREGRKASRVLIVAYAGLCLLAGMSNLLFLPHMLGSITIALLGGLFFGVIKIRECWLPVVIGWPVAGVGVVLNRVLFTATDISAESGVSYNRALAALDTFMRGFTGRVLAGNLLHVVALTWLTICAAYIVWTVRAVIVKCRSDIAPSQIMRAVFFATAFFSSVLSFTSIIAGGSSVLVESKDYVWSMHYLHMAFLFPLFAVPMALSWAIEKIRFARVLPSGVWIIAVVAFVVPVARFASMPSSKTPIYAYQPPLVRVMDQIAATTPLHYGLAGYWQARLITLLSKSGLRAYAVGGTLQPFLWVNNEQWYRRSLNDRTRPPQYDFVVLDDPNFKISREAAVRVFGEPSREIHTEVRIFGEPATGTRVLIYSDRK
jgi:hypothetical protein